MKQSHVLILAAIGVAAVLLFATRPGVETEGPADSPKDPARFSMAVHLAEHDVKIGSQAESDILVSREGDRIKVEMTEAFLAGQPETFLSTLGMTERVEWMSEDRYTEVLNGIELVVAPEGHDHDHDHEGEDHDHEGEDHDHSEEEGKE